MKFKKISTIAISTIIAAGLLVGCGGAKLPDGDVKVIPQPLNGVMDLLLQSANYGSDKSSVVSLLLPEASKYNITLTEDIYENGTLTKTEELLQYETGVIEKNTFTHIIANIDKNPDGKSIYSVAEVDQENSTDKKNPIYKTFLSPNIGIDFDVKSDVGQIGNNFDNEIPIIALAKFKADDSEKTPIDITNYESNLGNYEKVSILKVKVTKLS